MKSPAVLLVLLVIAWGGVIAFYAAAGITQWLRRRADEKRWRSVAALFAPDPRDQLAARRLSQRGQR